MSFLTLSINESDLHEVPVMQANERVPVTQAHAMPVNEGSSGIGNRNDFDAINHTMALSTQAMTAVSNMARRLQARVQENQQWRDEVCLLKQQVVNMCKEKKELKRKNAQLENAVQYYATVIMPRLTEIENRERHVTEAHEKLLREVKKKKSVKASENLPVIE
ncbi:hypothetical protein HYC85_029977 [Camellia sinensis]|uniref:Uncharacterized protein n=1 Tax=Camellia sinensis TaxID=4442 RepID=A0A7J7G3D9_CAMSI|nr:hypothetical protein HYC85_029977 [Camellia sinensis]